MRPEILISYFFLFSKHCRQRAHQETMGNQGGKEKDDKGDHLSREQLEDIHRRSHCTLIARALLPEQAVGKLSFLLVLPSAFFLKSP
jgi:hypothetical protein